MALPAYDPEKHHVGLALSPPSPDKAGLMIAGAYSKAFRRDVSDELAGVHYGADSLFNTPGVSSWTMDDFTGGAFQQVYGKDPAMFSHSDNLLPAQFDRSLRTVPPLEPIGDAGGSYAVPLCVYTHGGYFCALFPTRLYIVNLTNHAVSAIDPIGLVTGAPYTHAAYDRRSGKVFATFEAGASGRGISVLEPLSGALIVGIEPGAILSDGAFTGIDLDGDRIVVFSQHVLWTAELPGTSPAWIGDDWVRVGRLPAPYVASTWMAERLYILCGGSDQNASVVAFDGVQVMPVAEFPFNFVGESIQNYAGRIYVGGSGRDINDSSAYAELHEVTGSSVRLVKTFAPELRSGRYSIARSIKAMCVYEGLLFFGDGRSGLIAYDVTTDSLHGGQRFSDVQGAFVDRRMVKLIAARGRLWGWMFVGDNTSYCGPWFGPVAGDSLLATFGGQLYTSDFGPELDRKKSWKHLRLLTRGDAATPTIQASVNGGQSWITCPLTDTDAAGVASFRTYDLSAVPISRMVRFAIGLPRAGDNSSFAELVAFSAAFQLVDSDDVHADGTQKIGWSFAVAGVETLELQDGEPQTNALAELRDALWSASVSRDKLAFTDLDGQTYTVVVDSIRETQPVVLPPVDYDSPTDFAADSSGREAFYALQLVEA